MSGEGKVVCVTGGSGYVASWLVKLLLEHGYTVKATVRNPNDPVKVGNLFALDGAKERLRLFEADLLQEGSFDSAIDGCEGVFHVASPVSISATDPQRELIEPAVKGTINVLRSCAKVASVKRVVVTSSTAAVIFSGKPLNLDVVVDETWFSKPAICEELKYWYAVSKTLAEDAAWKFAEENGIDMVTINPGFVIGPLLQPILCFSVEMILNLINVGGHFGAAAKSYTNQCYTCVDVRDVAYAHIQAFETPSASGRYCLVTSNELFSEVFKIVHQLYPSMRLPETSKQDEGSISMPPYKVSMEKAKTLGINFKPLEVTLKDTIESLKEKGFLTI